MPSQAIPVDYDPFAPGNNFLDRSDPSYRFWKGFAGPGSSPFALGPGTVGRSATGDAPLASLEASPDPYNPFAPENNSLNRSGPSYRFWEGFAGPGSSPFALGPGMVSRSAGDDAPLTPSPASPQPYNPFAPGNNFLDDPAPSYNPRLASWQTIRAPYDPFAPENYSLGRSTPSQRFSEGLAGPDSSPFALDPGMVSPVPNMDRLLDPNAPQSITAASLQRAIARSKARDGSNWVGGTFTDKDHYIPYFDALIGAPFIQSLPTAFRVPASVADLLIGRTAEGVAQAAMFPARVLNGEIELDPENPSPEAIKGSLNFASTFAMPSLGRAAVVTAPERGLMSMSGAADSAGPRSGLGGLLRGGGTGAPRLEGKAAAMYEPPSTPPRPIEADYPLDRWPYGPPVNTQGRLTHDVDGRPIAPTAIIVGRASPTASDRPLAPSKYGAITKALIGSTPTGVPGLRVPGLGPGRLGDYYAIKDALGQIQKKIAFDSTLPPPEKNLVLSHEMGHMIDDLSGTIDPFAGTKYAGMIKTNPRRPISREAYALYNDLNHPTLNDIRTRFPQESWRPQDYIALQGFSPTDKGYSRREVGPELMAEARRAYLTDPNYIKTVAPNAAAAIRDAWNSNPRLASFLHFNSLGPLVAAGATTAAYGLIPVEGKPIGEDTAASPITGNGSIDFLQQ
jgi:hypothetical protein